MKIDSYSFGKISIDGKEYTSDLIIYPDRIDPSWWRRNGHYLQVEDLTDIIRTKPEILIIGTGYSGVMTVDPQAIDELYKHGIEVYIEKTGDAVSFYNELQVDKKIVVALHLTC